MIQVPREAPGREDELYELAAVAPAEAWGRPAPGKAVIPYSNSKAGAEAAPAGAYFPDKIKISVYPLW